MKDHLRVAARPSHVIAGLFLVSRIAKWPRFRGEVDFTPHLAAHCKHYIAIAGESGRHVSPGDLVHVRGCLLRRSDRPVLVASSLERIACGSDSLQFRQLVAVESKEHR